MLALNVEIVCQDPEPHGVRLVELMVGGVVFCRGYFRDTPPDHLAGVANTKRSAEWARYNALEVWGQFIQGVTEI